MTATMSKKRLMHLAGMLKESPYHLPGYDKWKTEGPPEEGPEPCDYCGGEGETWFPRDEHPRTCPKCKGTGLEPLPEPDIFPPELSDEDAEKIAAIEDMEQNKHDLGDPRF